jgi:2-phospho-L-lactate guanylyltransferase
VKPHDEAEVRPWAVVVPVKRLAQAKTRLAVLGDGVRRELALAFAEDVVLAAAACPLVRAVVVVTDDDDAAQALVALGAVVTPDRPDAGLDAALEHGAAVARAGADVGVAAVASDLPALTASALTGLLASVTHRGVVADVVGTGTTVLAAAACVPLAPSYGAGSLTRHVAGGAVLLPAPDGARRDVDTPADLDDALALGVGPHTLAVATRHRLADGLASPACCSPGAGTMHP